MPEVREEIVVPFPPSLVCDFFRSPASVAAISDPSVGAVLKDAPEVLHEGDEVRLELMAFGTTHRVTNRIVDADFPAAFTEEQVDGPLAAYRQRHEFTAEGDDTRVVDVIDFEPPGGLAGLLMSADAIESQLADSIDYRNRGLAAAIAKFADGRSA